MHTEFCGCFFKGRGLNSLAGFMKSFPSQVKIHWPTNELSVRWSSTEWRIRNGETLPIVRSLAKRPLLWKYCKTPTTKAPKKIHFSLKWILRPLFAVTTAKLSRASSSGPTSTFFFPSRCALPYTRIVWRKIQNSWCRSASIKRITDSTIKRQCSAQIRKSCNYCKMIRPQISWNRHSIIQANLCVKACSPAPSTSSDSTPLSLQFCL